MGGAGFLFVQKGVWIKVVYPCLALLVPLGLVVARRLTESERETRDVAAENLENQKLLGLSFQEKGMLDMALATFNKLPLTEDMKLVYVNLGLDYENRGHRDKAFLVYKKVFDVDPAFEGVARRMERLGQAGRERCSRCRASQGRDPAPGAGDSAAPLAHLLATPLPSELPPTAVVRRHPGWLLGSPSSARTLPPGRVSR